MVSGVGCPDPTAALKHPAQLAPSRRAQVAHDQRDTAISVQSVIAAGSSKITDLQCVMPALFEFEGEAPTEAGEPAVLLAAKSAPPAIRAQLIERAALIEILSAEPSRKLTLLSAPAGWGKTTLLAQWVSGADERGRRGWLSLDASDNDPARFWACAIAALGKASPGVAPRAFELIKMGADPRQVVLPTLLDELAAMDYQIALILDDYHLVENRTVHEQVGFVVERMPQTFQLVIATRSDPMLPLARLRARGELLELRAEELRFQAGEAADLLDGVLGLKLTDAQVQLLFRRTEGWAAGLYLAGLSLAGRTDAAAFIQTFAGDNRHIVDYLMAEVLDGQPPHLRSFLLRTSVLGRLSGALCDAVLQTSGSASVLEKIERENLFVMPLDMSRHWYRYHQLFGELLRTELRRSEPDPVADLHRRAATWFETEGLIDEALHHLIAAGDIARSADLIADWVDEFNGGGLSAISGIASTLLASPERSASVAVTSRNEGCAVGEELTPKEFEVLRLLATRLSRREIGERLFVSLNTVKTHQRAVYRKLSVEHRSAAVSRARELGLL
jgi:LuxR family maltose regulon positive regulatory protein